MFRVLTRAAVSLAVVAAGLVVLEAPAAAAVRGPLRYEVARIWKCLDVPGSNPNNGVAVIIFQCGVTAQPNQLWTEEDTGGGYVQIRNKASRKCLAVKGAATNIGQPIIQYTCNGTDNSEWKPVPVIVDPDGLDVYYLQNKNSKLCIHVKNASSANSTPLVQHECKRNGKDNNLWTWYPWS